MLLALHVPDHTLSPAVAIAAAVVVALAAAGGLVLRRLTIRRPDAATFAAVALLVFALQMVNFPLVGGATSGHVLGAALATIVLGPAFGVAAMALVLVAQCLLLGDGGLTALGANLLNMAVVAVPVAAAAHRVVVGRRRDATGRLIAAAAAGWVSTVAAAAACAAELAASGIGTSGELLGLVGQHALLGAAEGTVTAALVAVATGSPVVGRVRRASLVAATLIAAALMPFSSSLPDGLETVLAQHASLADH